MCNITWTQVLVILGGYVLAFLTSGVLVNFVLSNKKAEDGDHSKSSVRDTGAIIGKCENFLVITLILLGAYTALALVFTAKSIVRMEDIKKDSRYFLGGTLVNFSYSILIGSIVRVFFNCL